MLAGLLLHERLTGRQLAGIVPRRGGPRRASPCTGPGWTAAPTLLPVLLTLCGGLGWALGNLCNRQAAGAPSRSG